MTNNFDTWITCGPIFLYYFFFSSVYLYFALFPGKSGNFDWMLGIGNELLQKIGVMLFVLFFSEKIGLSSEIQVV